MRSCRSISRRTPRLAPHQPDLYRQRFISWNRDRLRDSVLPLARMNFDRRDLLPKLAELAMPALVMGGCDDVPRPASEGRRMAELMACPFVEIPASGHMASLENSGFVTERLGGFLGRVAAADRPKAPV